MSHSTNARNPMPAHAGGPISTIGELDANVGRWHFLFKWLLAMPHFIVLFVLWIGFVLSTAVAGVAILFTGRYPRRIFDFNVGVLRWTWRVAFYSFSSLGTDRYPPFSLSDEPTYAARLHVGYPERLSRGLVLVKWWLLAIPHYLMVAAVPAVAWLAWTNDGNGLFYESADGLIGLLVLLGASALLFTSRHPRPLYDVVIGIGGWAFRVVAYAGLMTDRYPSLGFEPGPMDAAAPTVSVPAVREAPARAA